MLNRAERYRILWVIGQCCKFGLFPARVDLSTWELIPYKSGLKLWNSRLSFFFFALHVMYKLGSLASAYFRKDVPLHELIIHAIMAVAPTVYAYWYYVSYIQHPGIFGSYVRMTLLGKIGALDDQETKPRTRRLKEYTPQDLFVISLPYMLFIAGAAIIITFIWYPTMSLLVYNALPREYQTWIIFAILIVEESRCLMVVLCITTTVWSMHVISFNLVNSRLQLLIDSIHRSARARRLENVYRSLRHIQLYMGLVNFINSFVIFSWKVLCIAMCVGTGYAAIAHFKDYPLFGVMYYMILLDAAFVYTFAYGKAFKIPALNEKVSQKAMMELRYIKSRSSKIFRLQIRSIPRVGVKVGEFHMMERESTLLFIHFVVNNIVAMLVAYR